MIRDSASRGLFSLPICFRKEMSSRIDPGIRVKELGGLYINFDGSKSKPVSSSLQKLKEKKIQDEVNKRLIFLPSPFWNPCCRMNNEPHSYARTSKSNNTWDAARRFFSTLAFLSRTCEVLMELGDLRRGLNFCFVLSPGDEEECNWTRLWKEGLRATVQRIQACPEVETQGESDKVSVRSNAWMSWRNNVHIPKNFATVCWMEK